LAQIVSFLELDFMTEARKSAAPKFTRAMVALIPFATAFARRGGDVELVLTKNRIPIGALSNPTMLVEANACYAAMEDMANLLGDQYFGASLAIEAANMGTPAIRDAAAQAVTFGDFLSRFTVEIARQVDNVDHRLEVSSRAAIFELRRMITPRGATTQVTAVNITFFVTLFKRGLGEVFDPARITVLAPTIEGVPASFLPSRNLLKSRLNGVRIVFPPEWLWAPFSLGWQTEEPHKEQFGDREGENLLTHFRAVMEANIEKGDLALNRFAELVGLPTRRVQRLLSANGTSYRQLKEDVRRGIALDLLANRSTPISEIASQLGFSAVSAFDRAFKQWTGTTPTHFRTISGPKRKH
jgi:AraC-like DNA-binding protein